MKMVILLYVYILSFWDLNARSYDLVPCSSDSLIIWNSSKKLTPEDFKGSKTRKGNGAEASYEITRRTIIEEDSIPDIEIVCLFNINKSWINDSSLQVLNHEQLHFDICELFARKMRKTVEELKNAQETNYKKYIKILYKLDEEHNATQDAYDKDCGVLHVNIKEFQKKWDDSIHAELEKLNEYKYYPCD